jgi:hypothetical protein
LPVAFFLLARKKTSQRAFPKGAGIGVASIERDVDETLSPHKLLAGCLDRLGSVVTAYLERSRAGEGAKRWPKRSHDAAQIGPREKRAQRNKRGIDPSSRRSIEATGAFSCASGSGALHCAYCRGRGSYDCPPHGDAI